MKSSDNQLLGITRSFLKQYSDPDIVQSTAKHLANQLEVDNVIIGYLISNGLRIRTISFISNGKDLGELEYDLEYTPCENIVNRKACYYPSNIVQLFPKDKELVSLKAESYLGTPIFDSQGDSIGLIAIIDSETIEDAEHKTEVLEEVAKTLSPVIEKEYTAATMS